jgi:hypothetical protein
VTTNPGRVIYIIYSLFTIPIITILVSLLSDSLLSRFQHAAEYLGVRTEDQRDVDNARHGLKAYFTFRRKKEAQSPSQEQDLEMGRPRLPSVGDEILEEEVIDEMEKIEERADELADEQMSKAGRTRSRERGAVRRRQLGVTLTGTAPAMEREVSEGAGFSEEDVDRAITEEENE